MANDLIHFKENVKREVLGPSFVFLLDISELHCLLNNLQL